MKIFTVPLEMYQSESYDDCKGYNPCILCGKDTGKNPKYFVHLLTNGDLVSSDEYFKNSQGLFPIGSECRKKLSKEFIFNNEY